MPPATQDAATQDATTRDAAPKTAAEFCTHLNAVNRKVALLDADIGRLRDALHRTEIARGTLVSRRGDLIAGLTVAEAREGKPAGGPAFITGPTVVGLAADLPTDRSRMVHPRGIADEIAHRRDVPHLDRSTSQVECAADGAAETEPVEIDEPFEAEFRGR